MGSLLSELNVKQFSITFCSTYFSSTSTGISTFGAFYFYFGGCTIVSEIAIMKPVFPTEACLILFSDKSLITVNVLRCSLSPKPSSPLAFIPITLAYKVSASISMAIDGPTARSWTFLALILSGIFMHKLYLTSRSCKTPHKYALASESIATFKFQHEALVNLTVLVDKRPTFFSPLLNYSIALKLKITRVLSCGLRPS